MRIHGAVGFALVVIVGWWAISMSRSLSPSETVVETDASSEVVAPVLTEKPVEGKLPATVPTQPEKPATPPPAKPFEYANELSSYAELAAKVLMTEEEKARKNRLLSDAALLRALGLRLTEASVDPSVTASQDLAVDLLVEALESGDQALASEVMKSVVEDPQVENKLLDRPVRENLAGIKAEVLYHWAAAQPDEAARIERSLPGPVSQKIWENVKSRHESNDAESQAEADEHLAKKGG